MWALCGPCVGPMWALCGPCKGVKYSLYGGRVLNIIMPSTGPAPFHLAFPPGPRKPVPPPTCSDMAPCFENATVRTSHIQSHALYWSCPSSRLPPRPAQAGSPRTCSDRQAMLDLWRDKRRAISGCVFPSCHHFLARRFSSSLMRGGCSSLTRSIVADTKQMCVCV